MASCYSFVINPRSTAGLPTGSNKLEFNLIEPGFAWNTLGINTTVFAFQVDLKLPQSAATDTNCWVKVDGTWRPATMSVLGA